ncbi:MAG: hypothetical protein QM652_11880 [Legionella sp.]|uniref:HAD family hydrolase n=1 Tax=Legionella sp. TaxID=459 RepID=UPI0039E719A7
MNDNKTTMRNDDGLSLLQFGDTNFWKQIETADVISFDFFDTLFVRLVSDPEDVFDLLGQMWGIEHFRTYRKQAQTEAFQRMIQNGRREISIADIYEGFQIKDIPINELITRENELELKLIQPNAELFPIFKHVLNSNKRIIITSDMYLSGDFFIQALEKYGISGIPIYCSADKNATKRDSGELFQIIVEELSVLPQNVLHIGDNHVADYKWAQKRGLKAYHYVASPAVKKDKDSPLISSIVHSLLDIRAKDIPCGSYEAFGFLYGGAAALAFIEWIKEKAQQDTIDHILFLARDGYVMQQLIEKLDIDGLPKCNYFHGSRTAFTLAAMTQENFTQYIPYLLSGCDGLSPNELLERIGVPSPAPSVMSNLGLGNEIKLSAELFPLMSEFLYAYRWEILKVCQRNLRGLFNYIKSLGIQARQKVALVDVGWRGTSQEAFIQAVSSFLELDIYGYYFCLANPSERIKSQHQMKLSALLDSSSYSIQQIDKIYNNRVMIELLFSAPHDTIIGYDPDNNNASITDFGRGTEKNITKHIDAICKGSIRFVELYRELSRSAHFNLTYHELIKGILEFIDKDKWQNIPILNELYNFDAWASSKNKRRAPKGSVEV